MKIHYYLHTHWDREWYQLFESYRFNLVFMISDLIEKIKSNEINKFVLDGQLIILDDIKEIDSEVFDEVLSLIKEQKIEIGPWYVLCDENLVSGQSLIRNLLVGYIQGKKLGNYSEVGYCPDTFGHCADLPKILNLFDIYNAIVWRGLDRMFKEPLFNWLSNDSSCVLTHVLVNGYYNTLLTDAKNDNDLVNKFYEYVETQNLEHSKGFISSIESQLIPFGGDHIFAPENTKHKINFLEKNLNSQNSTQFIESGLNEFFETIRAFTKIDNLEKIQHDLNSNKFSKSYKYGYLLNGVWSTRMYLKINNRKLENLLFNILEPLFVLLNILYGFKIPNKQLDYVTKLLLQNQPHDSICGCSIDAVHQEMIARYNKAFEVCNSLLKKAISSFMTQENNIIPYFLVDNNLIPDIDFDPKNINFINLSGYAIQAPQLISFSSLRAKKYFKNNPYFQIIKSKKNYGLFMNQKLSADYKDSSIITGYIFPQKEVPPFGITSQTIYYNDTQQNNFKNIKYLINNELYGVYLDKDSNLIIDDLVNNETFNLHHSFIDEIDCGDSYNFDTLNSNKPTYSNFIKHEITQEGTLVQTLTLHYEISIPNKVKNLDEILTGITNNSRNIKANCDKFIKHKIQTSITLQKNVNLIQFKTCINNKSSDHRLKVIFKPTKIISKYYTHNHFSINEKKPIIPQKHEQPCEPATEYPRETDICEKFFIVNDNVFFNKGLPEISISDNSIEITLLRSISRLSARRLFSRGGGAGPNLNLIDSKCFGKITLEYAWSYLPNLEFNKNYSQIYKLAAIYENQILSFFSLTNLLDRNLISIDSDLVNISSISNYSLNDRGFLLYLQNLSDCGLNATLQLNFECKSVSKVKLNLNIIKSLVSQESADNCFKTQLSFKPHELIVIRVSL